MSRRHVHRARTIFPAKPHGIADGPRRRNLIVDHQYRSILNIANDVIHHRVGPTDPTLVDDGQIDPEPPRVHAGSFDVSDVGRDQDQIL